MKPARPTYHYAGLKVRALAMAFDLMVIAGYAVVLAIAASVFLRSTSASRLMDSAWTRDGVAFLTLIFPTILYFALQESSRRQATFGKRKMGLRVTDGLGRRRNLPELEPPFLEADAHGVGDSQPSSKLRSALSKLGLSR